MNLGPSVKWRRLVGTRSRTRSRGRVFWGRREAYPQRLRATISPLNTCGPLGPVLWLQWTRRILRSHGGWDPTQGRRSVLWVQ